MAAYIKKGAVLDALFTIAEHNKSALDAYNVVCNIPATVVLPNKSRWEELLLEAEVFGDLPRVLCCGRCRRLALNPSNYCPHCGADMREEVERDG